MLVLRFHIPRLLRFLGAICRSAWRILFQYSAPVFVVDGQYFVWRLPAASSAWIHVKSSTRRSAFGIRWKTRKTILHNGTSKNEGTGASVHQWRMIDRLTRCKHIFRDGQNTLHPLPFRLSAYNVGGALPVYILAYFIQARERERLNVCGLKRMVFNRWTGIAIKTREISIANLRYM